MEKYLFIYLFFSFFYLVHPWHCSFPTIGLTSPKARYPFTPHQFTIAELAPRAGSGASIALIDTSVANNELGFSFFDPQRVAFYGANSPLILINRSSSQFCKITSNHSLFAAGLIGGPNFFAPRLQRLLSHNIPIGIAPKSNISIFGVFDNCGSAAASQVIKTIETARQVAPDVVCMSFKLDGAFLSDSELDTRLKNVLKKIPFSVAAAGNFNEFSINAAQEAFPARSNEILFDVGSFGLNGATAQISDFSCWEKGVGPLFVMPGEKIKSVTATKSNNSIMPFVMSGTSISAALMSSALALIIAEFPDFSSKQIATVCYASAIKLQKTTDWQERVILGTLDVRLALFILHVLRSLRSLGVEIENKFLQFTFIIKELLFYEAELCTHQQFGKSVSLQNNFLEFVRLWQHHPNNQSTFEKQTLSVVVDGIAKKLKGLTNNKTDKKIISQSIIAILSERQENLLPIAALERLKSVSD